MFLGYEHKDPLKGLEFHTTERAPKARSAILAHSFSIINSTDMLPSHPFLKWNRPYYIKLWTH